MRKDMKDVLVTPGRYGKYDEARKTQTSNDVEKLESLPEREGMKRRYAEGGWGWSFGDHINPLRRWLHKRVGKLFDDVYSEFCEHNDARSIRGWHARDHFWMEVDTYEERLVKLERRWSWPSRFYIDADGVLCEEKNRRRWRFGSRKPDPDKCQIGDRKFERINNCWFETWYGKSKTKVYIGNGEWKLGEEIIEKKRQLSKKELKQLGFKNGPDFKWWENG